MSKNTKEHLEDLFKFNKVNKTKSLEDLAKLIESFADKNGVIQGNSKLLSSKEMVAKIKEIQEVDVLTLKNGYGIRYYFNWLTRSYGIRQQAIYLKLYNKIENEI